MHITNRLLLLVACITLSSCSDTLMDYQFPFEEGKPIAYGDVDQHGAANVEIYETLSLNSTDTFKIIENLDVSIVDANDEKHTLAYNGHNYADTLKNLKYPVHLEFSFKDNMYRSTKIEKALPLTMSDIMLDSIQEGNSTRYIYIYTLENNLDKNIYAVNHDTSDEKDPYYSARTLTPKSSITSRSNSFTLKSGERITKINSSVSKIIHDYVYRSFENEENLGNPAAQNNSSPSNIIDGYGYFGSRYTVRKEYIKK